MKFLSLLTLSVFALHAAFSHETEHGHQCTHDHIDHPEPEFLKIQEENFPVTEEGRLLASSSSFRIYGHFSFLSGSLKTYMENTLGPAVISYFEGALRVKYPVSGKLTLSSSQKTICSKTTPSVLHSGVSADFFMMWDASYDKPASATSTTWVAESVTCMLADGSNRPLIAKTLLNSAVFVNPGSDVLLHEKNIYMILHETTHVLGFSSSLFKYFLSSSGKKLSGHIQSGTLSGYKTTVLDVEPLTSKLRSFFGCSSLKGAYMENTGSTATKGSHFERRQFAFEAMTSGLIYQQSYSQFTLALLEGSGWYVPDYDFADPYWFGQGQGCNFLTKTCSSINSQFSDLCSGSGRKCTVVGRGGGSCGTDVRSDGCKFVHPSISYDCDNEDAEKYARLPSLQAFGRSAYSKCFEGTLTSTSTSSATTFCFKTNCVGSGSNTRLEVTVGSKTLTCTEEGSMSVEGYKGYIKCPDPLSFCSTVGAKKCPRGCMGRGNCSSGKCVCNKGYKGKDCSLNA